MSETYAQAVYCPTGLIDYDGNPFIEALPPILDEREVASGLLAQPPLPSVDEQALPPKTRVHAVSRLNQCFFPLHTHLQLEDEFSQLIRLGYTGRHPFRASTVGMLHAETLENTGVTGFASSAKNLTVIGLSGMGKTTTLKGITRLYPQVIKHTEYKGRLFVHTQVVWLHVESPHDGSMKGFCAAFFSALDKALGVDTYSKFVTDRNSAEILLQRIGRVCRSYFIGAIIIDEMQHLRSKKSDKEKLLNFFVTLSNDAGVPLIYVGTYAMLPLFSAIMRNARRAIGMGMVSFDRFEQNDEYWDYLVEMLWQYDWTGQNQGLSQDLRDTIYDLTQGNIDFLSKLLFLSQRHAIYESDHGVTPDLLRHVYKSQMSLLHNAINALRSRDQALLATFDDILPSEDKISQMMNANHERNLRMLNISRLVKASSATPQPRKQTINTTHLTSVDNEKTGIASEISKSSNLREALAKSGFTKKNQDQ